MEFPNWLAGTVTLVALVGLGIFVYPWLLQKRGGVVITAAITLALAALYWAFDHSSPVASWVSALLGLFWALTPVIAAVIVMRINRQSPPAN